MKLTRCAETIGLICLLYEGLLLCLEGREAVPFWWIWIVAAGWMFLVSIGNYYSKKFEKIPEWLPISMKTFWVTCSAILCVTMMITWGVGFFPETKDLDYLLILGSDNKSSIVSLNLQKRLDRAIRYTEENPHTILILSGGQKMENGVSRSEYMKDYLTYNGVEERQILLEERGTSTSESVAYVKTLIEQMEAQRSGKKMSREALPPGPYLTVEVKPPSVGVITEAVHIFRIKRIAAKRGLAHLAGIRSGTDWMLLPHETLMECLMILKDQFMGNM